MAVDERTKLISDRDSHRTVKGTENTFGNDDDDHVLRQRTPPRGGGTHLSKAFSIEANMKSIFRRGEVARGDGSFDALDGLRALAFFWVVLFHCQLWAISMRGIGPILQPLAAVGDSGVTLFLVLSGFLLAHIMLKELESATVTDMDVKTGPMHILRCYGSFMWRRFARIYPSLIGVVFLVQGFTSVVHGYAFDAACGSPRETPLPGIFKPLGLKAGGIWLPVLRNVLLVNNLYATDDGSDVCPYCPATCAPWTVSVEFQFYLALPFVVTLYWFNRGAGLVLAVAIYATSLGFREGEWMWSFQYLICEYVAGAIAYLVVGKWGLNWISSFGKGARDLVYLHIAQVFWLVVTICFFALMYMDMRYIDSTGTIVDYDTLPTNPIPRHTSHMAGPPPYIVEGDRFKTFGRPILALSTATLIAICCAVSSDGFIRQHNRDILSKPFQAMCAALSSPVLYPMASVSYTSYLGQGLVMNLVRFMPYSPELAGNGDRWWVFILVLVADLLFGLVLSLTLERPVMKLLNVVRPKWV